MDSSNINCYFYEKLCDKSSNLTLTDLLHVGKWGLYILHGLFTAGENATEQKQGKILKALFNLFRVSATRTADYAELTVCPMQHLESALAIGNCHRNCRQNKAKKMSEGTK